MAMRLHVYANVPDLYDIIVDYGIIQLSYNCFVMLFYHCTMPTTLLSLITVA